MLLVPLFFSAISIYFDFEDEFQIHEVFCKWETFSTVKKQKASFKND